MRVPSVDADQGRVGRWPAIALRGNVDGGRVSIGLLDATRSEWLAQHSLEPGAVEDRLIFDAKGSTKSAMVITTDGAGRGYEASFDERGRAGPRQAGIRPNEARTRGGRSATRRRARRVGRRGHP